MLTLRAVLKESGDSSYSPKITTVVQSYSHATRSHSTQTMDRPHPRYLLAKRGETVKEHILINQVIGMTYG